MMYEYAIYFEKDYIRSIYGDRIDKDSVGNTLIFRGEIGLMASIPRENSVICVRVLSEAEKSEIAIQLVAPAIGSMD